jgi:chemotaxis signal transduction protein
MTVHLRVMIGECDLLLDTAWVQRVAPAADVGDMGGDVGAWAGRETALFDLPAMLGSDAPDSSHRAVVLYGPIDRTVVLVVDDVKGLVSLEPDALAPMPRISSAFGQLFDAICVQPIEGRHPLRLRARIEAPGSRDGA